MSQIPKMAGQILSCVSLTALLFLPMLSSASGILYQFNAPFPSNPSPAGSNPWLTADFENANNGVLLTISGAGLTGTEFASAIYFNLEPTFNPASLTFLNTASSGTFSFPTIDQASQNSYKADGDGKYDFRFNFGTASGTTFGSGDSITYLISGISGLVATNFVFLSQPAGGNGPFFAAAHIQSLAGGASSWIQPGGGPITTPAPEPAPVALLAVSAILFGVFRLRMSKV